MTYSQRKLTVVSFIHRTVAVFALVGTFMNMAMPIALAADAATPAYSIATKPMSALPMSKAAPGKVFRNTLVTSYTSSVAECDGTPFTTADGSDVRHGITATRHDDSTHPLYSAWDIKAKKAVKVPADGIKSVTFLPTNKQVLVDGIIAANFLPFGTQVRLPKLFGDQIFEVHDRLNARYNGDIHIDLWVTAADGERVIDVENSITRNGVTLEVVKMGTGEKQWYNQPVDIAYVSNK